MSALNNVAGGWTTDTGYIDLINDAGYAMPLFKAAVTRAVKEKLEAVEIAASAYPYLSDAEKALRNSGDYSIDWVVECIKTETKYITRVLACPYSDVQYMVNAQWQNILKRWKTS
jgi:hypothetical protein